MPNVLSCAVLRYYDAACDKFGALCKCDYKFMELEAQEWGSNGESNAITQILSESTISFARRMKRLVHTNEIRHFISLTSGYFHEDSVYH
jgi:hypothetical protein